MEGFCLRFLPHNNVIALECRQHVEMLRDNKLAPYTFRTEKQTFLFLLNYAKLSDCLPQISQLQRASTLPRTEQSSMIAAIVYSRQSRVSFDTLWLGDLYEKVVLETQGNKITPLVLNPGRILLTSARLYFQPYNNVEPYPVLKICLQDIKRIEKRRFLLQHVGLEIYSENSHCRSHFYVTLKTSKQRDELYAGLIAQELVTLDDTDQHSMTLKWQNGILSNFDYLLYVNSLADRSFNDLTQYPVFPWVVADYTSEILDLRNPKTFRNLRKPVGALDETRLRRLKERYDEMSPPKFLYGSHYSTPGFVLFYLVRKFPQFMLCLQNGRFDHPDRMFNSISDVWNNVLRNMSDFKELVPEFYDPQNYGDLFINGKGINFGCRHDGTKVANVALPPWAKGPLDFVTKNQEALESDYVSTNLHHWIDLIFGYKQTGIEAEKADNLFYYLCYEGAIDLDSIADRSERHALEVQIMEFGQIPKQIFNLPHPQRRVGQKILDPDTDPGSSGGSGEIAEKLLNEHIIWKNFGTLNKKTTFHSHKESVTSVAISSSNAFVVSVGQDSLLKIHLTADGRQVRSVSLSSMPLSACLILADDRTLLVGSWDNNITLYNVEFGRAVDSMRSHDDAVSCLAWGRKSGVVASGSWDCSVRVWKGIADGKHLKVTSALAAELDHESHVSCLAFDSKETLLLSGTQDGEIFIWSMDSHSLLQKMPGHTARVNDASFSPDGKKIVTCGDDREFKVLDLGTGTLLYNKTLDQELKCLAWDGCTLLVGGSLGSLFVWDLVKVVILTVIRAHEGSITSIAVSQDGTMVVTGGEDRKVLVWETTEV